MSWAVCSDLSDTNKKVSHCWATKMLTARLTAQCKCPRLTQLKVAVGDGSCSLCTYLVRHNTSKTHMKEFEHTQTQAMTHSMRLMGVQET